MLLLAVVSCQPLIKVNHHQPRWRPDPTAARRPAAHFITAANQTVRHHSQAALAGYLRAVRAAGDDLRANPADSSARAAYNFALARVFGILRDQDLDPWSRPLEAGEFTLTYAAAARSPGKPTDYRFYPTDEINTSSKGFPKPALRDGLGATLVAVRRHTNEPHYERTLSTRFVCFGVTAVASFTGNRCTLTLHDPLADETVRLQDRSFPLAGDFTTAPAMFFQHERPDKLRLISLFRPYAFVHTTALYRLQPYDPARIPVVLVHGMQDTPATWMPMFSSLMADEGIRRKYQFWFFAYPSGYPYPYSALLLREKLDLAARAFPGHQPVVLVGHSLGGLIARLMVLDSGDRLWLAYFHRSPAKTPLRSQDRKHLEGSLIFTHRRDVGRVIYLAAPHRGTIFAANWIGRTVTRLVQLPADVLTLGQDIVSVAAFQQSGFGMRRIPSCIDTMAPDNFFIREVNKLPPVSGIPYHSVIADRGRGNTPDSDDGVVAYWSCHLDGAASETIVPCDHMVNQHPSGIAEVRRLLYQHADKHR